MGKKKGNEFFSELSKKPFDEFMVKFCDIMHEYNSMIFKCMAAIEQGEDPSRHHCYKMRQVSIDIEKFGKQFRERTLLMQKNRKKEANSWKN